jgi:hypothetical protein
MLEYLKRASLGVSRAQAEYRVDALESSQGGPRTYKGKKKAYSDRLNAIRNNYLSLVSVTIHSVKANINPSTSTLGDVSFYFTARNNSDRIVTDIIYKPLIKGRGLSTTTSLVLEFLDPRTMKSGLGARETMTNQGHEAEKFTFFIGRYHSRPQGPPDRLREEVRHKHHGHALRKPEGLQGAVQAHDIPGGLLVAAGALEAEVRQAKTVQGP